MKDTAYDNIKSNKKTRFHYLSLENTFLEKPQEWGRGGGGGGVKLKHLLSLFGLTFQKWIAGLPGPPFSLSSKNFLYFLKNQLF